MVTTTSSAPPSTRTAHTAAESHRRWSRGPGWPRQVRARILGWYALLLFAAIVTSIILERQILLTRIDRRIDRQLSERAGELAQLATNAPGGRTDVDSVRLLLDSFLAKHEPARGESFLAFVDGRPYRTVLTGAAAPLSEWLARWAGLKRAARGALSTSRGPARYVAVPIGAGESRGVLVAMADPTDERSDAEAAVTVLAVISLSVLAVSSLFAWIVAGHVLAPIQDVTDAARNLSERDLSERIDVQGDDEVAELAKTFNAMLDRLENAFRTRRDFLNDVSHELRTPITIIRGNLELMGEDPQERREVLALVTDELDRMARLVNDLLVLARAEQPGFLQVQPVDIAELTESVAIKLRGLAPRDWRIESIAPVTIQGDRDRLTQALVNLASNAVAHTKEGDPIHLGSLNGGGHVRLWVRDEGPGVDPAMQNRLFERFQSRPSANGATGKTRASGLGLGLAIVRAIAEAHGGKVTVASEPGHGATFELTLPKGGAA